MALPTLVVPSTIPDWRMSPHDFTLPAPFAEIKFATGHSRKRRVALAPPRIVSVGLLLTEDQAQDFHAWFEEDAEAGALPFSARLLSDDGTRVWWRSIFVEPPRWNAAPSTRGPMWSVSSTLRLEGEASTTAPA